MKEQDYIIAKTLFGGRSGKIPWERFSLVLSIHVASCRAGYYFLTVLWFLLYKYLAPLLIKPSVKERCSAGYLVLTISDNKFLLSFDLRQHNTPYVIWLRLVFLSLSPSPLSSNLLRTV